MKKIILNIICVVFVFILVFSTHINVYANSKNDNASIIEPLIKEMEEMNRSYYSQIENIMLEQGGAKSYDINNAYRVEMMEALFLSILNDGQDFKNTVTDVVQWKIPFVTAQGEPGLVVLLEKEGKLSYIGKHTGETTKTWQISTEAIRDSVKNASEFDGEIYSIQIVHSYLYNTAFVYLDGEKSDYLIPYGIYSKETGLENGKVYTLSEVTKQFNKCFDEKIMQDNPSHNGGVPFRTSISVYIPMVLVAVFIFVGGVVLFWGLKRKVE